MFNYCKLVIVIMSIFIVLVSKTGMAQILREMQIERIARNGLVLFAEYSNNAALEFESTI